MIRAVESVVVDRRIAWGVFFLWKRMIEIIRARRRRYRASVVWERKVEIWVSMLGVAMEY